jgi:hypothetical protein
MATASAHSFNIGPYGKNKKKNSTETGKPINLKGHYLPKS